ncbi:tripartite tricarboxylate transporter TctB family protein [Prauserella cavernicola]|uniref:Tripartite tricarboxylate transporter TctB family protein n=1 Tax=Prauserella cavernicola TaxID=2800127 RepID=A0A934V973_9PSEU|nr:tripartite tricarboxylate transporter TctB family protein [Prauserella cavernicola]MBK1789429.1 tripartite tricarboxylate transporter TctB family protein [Prauserella cavernicola]
MPLDSYDRTEPAEHSTPDTEPETEPRARLGLAASLAVHIGVTLLGVAGLVLAFGVGVGSPTDPGPGLWPLVAASLMTAAGMATIVRAALGERVESLRGSARPALGVALAVLFVLLFSFVSVLVALLVVYVLWTRLLGGMAWIPVLCWSLGGTAVMYVLFGVVLGTPFPAPLTAIP